MLRTLAVALTTALACLPALVPLATAQTPEPELLANHRDWYAYTWTENGNRVCYMVTQPKRSEPSNLRHGEVYALVVHRPAENKLDVVNIQTGYNFEQNSTVSVVIDERTFNFVADQTMAWSPDAATDQALVAAMKAGRNMTAQGVSARGNETSYTFSLLGFTAAHDEISRACGVTS